MLLNFDRIVKNIIKKERTLEPVSDARLSEEQDFLARAKEKLEALEALRKEKLEAFQFRKKIAVPVALVLLPFLVLFDYVFLAFRFFSDDTFSGITLLVLGGFYWWVTQPRRDYAKEYKVRILPSLAKLFGNFFYDVNGKIDMAQMEPSKIVPHHHKYDSEDCFKGQYMGVDIEFSEIGLKQKRRSKNRTYYVSVFKGLAVLLDMKTKRFYGHTILDENKGKIGEWFKERTLDLKRANLVDPVFEDRFDVYTNDQVEARYLVDPSMMERLNAMYEEYDGQKMAAAFYESKMLILISSDYNYFEPAQLEVPATDPRSVLSMKKEIGEILSIVERLELYDPDALRSDSATA
ncbi:MAG: DUF3137 domain-containing protein [Alphaproteobacteria bacterium]